MQISKLHFLTALFAVLPGTLAIASPCTSVSFICDGDLKCCSMPLQRGTIAAYCGQGNMPGTYAFLLTPL